MNRALLGIVFCLLLAACGGEDEKGKSRRGIEGEGGGGGSAPDLCAESACENGACEVADGVASCVCEERFAGEACDRCEVNFAGDDCSACAPGWAGAQCDVCAEGHEGDDCQSCRAGWTKEGDRCVATCASLGLDCGVHGTCDDADGSPACVCDRGYEGADCSSCARGWHDGDGDGVCNRFCGGDGGLTCVHGSCDESTGDAICLCDGEFEGERCDRCPAGKQDNDGNGICMPTCATAGILCFGLKMQCSDESGIATCDCAKGFVRDGGDCVWGGLQDPELMDPSAWETEGDVTIETVDGGYANFAFDHECYENRLSQTFAFDSFDELGPMALEVTGDFGRWVDGNLTAIANGYPLLLPTVGSTPHRHCLGAGAYGPQLALEFSVFRTNVHCYLEDRIDSVRIVPTWENDCPAPSRVLDGEFMLGKWTSLALGGAEARVDTAEGVGKLSRTGGDACDPAYLQGWISLPKKAEMPHPALELDTVGTGRLDMWVAEMMLGSVGVSGDLAGREWQRKRICLPSWMEGTAQLMRLELAGESSPCERAGSSTIWVDDATLVNEPACGGVIPNGNFEGPENLSSFYYSAGGGPSAVKIDRTSGAAHRGRGALKVTVFDERVGVTIPYRQPALQRPALRAWVKGESGSSLHVRLAGTEIAVPSGWTEIESCVVRMPDGFANAHVEISGAFRAGEAVWIDDVELVDSPDC